MAYEQLKHSTLLESSSAILADFSDLLQKEMRLARAEMSEKFATKIRGGVWKLAAGILGLIAIFLMVQALVFAIASYGVALHWACLIVAGLLGAVGGLAYSRGRADAEANLLPTRTINQIKQDIATTKEQLT
jgi:hypothetical protein